MTATMTYVGLDVHARSTHAAAIEVATGELRRARFGGSSEEVVAWLAALPQPLRGCYEAGPTGFALYRAAQTAGLDLRVIAPSKTPRAPGDRIKTDRKDAELLARLLLAGQLKEVSVPSVSVEAARHLSRAREQVRGDLMRCRHRVSKLLLLHGRVYPEPSTWTQRHRQWLAGQQFEQPAAELAYLDGLAAVDGLVARKAALEERLSHLAVEGEWASTVARLRCFRGIDTLSAFALCLEIGDFARFQRPAQLAAWLGLVPALNQSGESSQPGLDHQDRLRLRPSPPRRGRLALPARAADRRHAPKPPAGTARARPPDRLARPTPPPPPPTTAPRPRQTGQPCHRRRRPRTHLLPLGSRRGELTPDNKPACSGGRRADAAGTRDSTMGNPIGPRPLLDGARRRRNKGTGVPNPRMIRLTADDRRHSARRPPEQPQPRSTTGQPRAGPLTTRAPYQ